MPIQDAQPTCECYHDADFGHLISCFCPVHHTPVPPTRMWEVTFAHPHMTQVGTCWVSAPTEQAAAEKALRQWGHHFPVDVLVQAYALDPGAEGEARSGGAE